MAYIYSLKRICVISAMDATSKFALHSREVVISADTIVKNVVSAAAERKNREMSRSKERRHS